jgi:SAM-dependent methyltransferase
MSSVAEDLNAFIRQHGAWTAHNIHLGGGVYTMGERPLAEAEGLKRIVQTVADVCARPIDQLRVLDLGCGEAGLGIEFARHGARVLCVDGREESLEKGRFVQRTLGLTTLEFRCDDVRNLSESAYGRFDAVLCVGLLYHLNEPDALDLLRLIASVCDRVAVVHTHISLGANRSVRWRDHEYHGRRVLEHLPGDDKEAALWASLQNDFSFWLTRASLLNALMDVGFTTVVECRIPFVAWQATDHATIAAIRGARVPTLALPAFDGAPAARVPEHAPVTVHPSQTWFYPTYRRLSQHVPRGVKNALRRSLAAAGGLGLSWSKQADRLHR